MLKQYGIFKKTTVFFAILTYGIVLYPSMLYSGLKEDKDDIVTHFEYIEEDAAQPVLRALYAKGIDSYETGKFKDASFYFRKILDIEPNYKQAEFLADAVEKMKKYDSFEARDIVIADYYEEGRSFYIKGQYLKALNIWEKILVLNPHHIDFIRSSIYDARKLLADPYYNRGWKYYRKENYDQAIEEWEQVLALDPAYHGLAELLEKTKEKALYVRIQNMLEKAGELSKKEKLKEALKVVNDAKRYNENYEPTLSMKKTIEARMARLYYLSFNKGLEQFKERKYKSAIGSFRQAIGYTLDSRQIEEARGRIRKARYEISLIERDKRIDSDTVVAEKIVSTKRDIDEGKVRKHYNQGLYYYKNGYLEKAIAEWEIVLNLNPEHEKAYTNLQRAKIEAKKKRR